MRLRISSIIFFAISWCVSPWNAYGQASDSAYRAAKEYCGKDSAVTLGNIFLHWDCSDLKVKTIKRLEKLIQETHSAPNSSPNQPDKFYESYKPHYSVWMFFGGNMAVRYRAIFQEDVWSGIGITTFCAETRDACARFEAFVAKNVPPLFNFKLGPGRAPPNAPPPPTPPAIRD